MRWSQRVFRWLLLAYPKRIRKARGTDMWLTFQDHLRDARADGWLAALDLWRREVNAVWRGRRGARISTRQPGRPTPVQDSTHTKRDLVPGLSILDFKLGLRMLVKYPGLTAIGGVGIAVAIAIGVGAFGFIDSFGDPTLPFEEDERLVTVQHWDIERNREHRQILHDVISWREEARTIEDLGAAVRVPGRNLITEDGRVELVRLAVISASGFSVTRVAPFLGRALLERDEAFDAPPVVVLGYGVWRDVFESDPAAVGARVRLGDTEHTVVGVMPEGFAFPVNDEIWTALQLDPLRYKRGEGPDLITFGRLVNGATLTDARAEFRTLAQRTAAHPESNRRLRSQVMPYALPFLDIEDPQTRWLLRLWQGIMSLVLVVVCVNVAVLVYARTAMRQREIGVRTALGASRRRVVAQLFVEALVLSAAAALVGVMLAYVAVGKIDAFWRASAMADAFPFWLDMSLSPASVVYALGLTVLAAVIVGVLPGLKATSRDVHANLQRLGARGFHGTLGGTWTLLIVTQVAVAVAVLPVAAYQALKQVRSWNAYPGFPADEFVTARIVLEADSSARTEPGGADTAVSDQPLAIPQLVRRLESDPLIDAVTFSSDGIGQGSWARIKVDEMPLPTRADGSADSRKPVGRTVFATDVAVDYFKTFDIPLLGGRAFTVGDLQSGSHAVIVNRSFARRVLRGGNPVGRRIRYVHSSGDQTRDTEEPWFEIVGMVDDFAHNPNFDGGVSKVYTPIAAPRYGYAHLAIRMRSHEVAEVATRLRKVGASVDPTMQLYSIQSEGYTLRQERRATHATALVVGVALLCVILLSSAGIYALMSFTVTKRRREIGIRTALGGPAHRIVLGVCARAIAQVTAGVLVGVALAALLNLATGGLLLDDRGAIVLSMGSLVMMAVGFAAALGPARRGLRVQPTEALREAD